MFTKHTEWLSQKKTHIKENKKEKLLQQKIISRIPEYLPDSYPLARSIKRHFTLHIGPTNSGKTHFAMQALKDSLNGAFFAPLRLLAYEQYERLNNDGYPCTLLTGEERIITDNARFTASTIEMANFTTFYETVVIDEAQMLSDKDRGGAWTAAILGLYSPNIHICMSPDAEKIIETLIKMCGDTYTVTKHERKTKLLAQKKRFIFPNDVEDGDALVVFSRKSVHSVAAALSEKHIPCSIIYGALPYDVRHAEAEKFADGRSNVVVSTDAIGMGLNLPIKRVVFLETEKFDGHDMRMLTASEIKQIAGRAGRFGLYNEGIVASTQNISYIQKKIEEPLKDIQKAALAFPEALVDVDDSLSNTIKAWTKTIDASVFETSGVENLLALVELLEKITQDKKFIYKCATIAVDVKNTVLLNLWYHLCNVMLKQKESGIEIFSFQPNTISYPKNNLNSKDMELLEIAYRETDLYYQFAVRFNYNSFLPTIQAIRYEISDLIFSLLQQGKYTHKTCKSCGKILPFGYQYGYCDDCYFSF